MEKYLKISPLKILEKSSHKELGKGNLGVLISRAGVGKTSCLIHVALDRLFRKGKIVHVSLKDTPEKVISYYNVICLDVFKSLDMEDEQEVRAFLDKNRIILAYLKESFGLDRLSKNLKNLTEDINFKPDTLIIDGFDFEESDRNAFEKFKEMAKEFQIEIWFSALSHRHINKVNERGIPFPCSDFDDLFNLIIQLQPTQEGLFLKLLKDNEVKLTPDVTVRLDPNNFFVIGQ